MSYRKYIFYGAYLTCPYCGGKGKYRLWYYNTTPPTPIADECGACFRTGCSRFNYFPNDYFFEHPEAKGKEPQGDWMPMPDLPITYINCVLPNLAKPPYTAGLLKWLQKSFPIDDIQRSIEMYQVGQRLNGQIEWPQIDGKGNLREIKLQAHDIDDGHRTDKVGGYWVGTYTMHAELVKCGFLEESRAEQCLFGEHLISRYPDKTICVVESEKTAFVLSLIFDDYVWAATGGSHFISKVKAIKNELKGRTVIVYPDAGTYDEWSEKLQTWKIDCTISPFCETFKYNTDVLDIYFGEGEKDTNDMPDNSIDEVVSMQTAETSHVDNDEAKGNAGKHVHSLVYDLTLARQMLSSSDTIERCKAQLFWGTYNEAMKDVERWYTPTHRTIVAMSPANLMEHLAKVNPSFAALCQQLDLCEPEDLEEPF